MRLAKEMQQSQKIIEDTDPNFNESDIFKMVEILINNQKIIRAISEKFEIKLIHILQ